MTIRELQTAVHEQAIISGWWDRPPEFGTLIALVHSELSEALEEVRDGSAPDETYFYCMHDEYEPICNLQNGSECKNCEFLSKKPEGVPSELADAVIRIMDICEFYGIDLGGAIIAKHEYNKTREHRHGGKKF